MSTINYFFKKKSVRLITRGLFCVVSLTGILLTMRGDPSIFSSLSYYTTQSNILALVVMMIFLWREIRGKSIEGRKMLFVKGAASVALFVTFLVFHFALRPTMVGTNMESYTRELGNVLVHYIAPLWFMLDHFLFDRKGSFRSTDPLLFLLIPAAYYLYVNVFAAFGGLFYFIGTSSRYPYFFLNPELMGSNWMVLLAIVVVLILMTILGFGFIGIDRLLSRKSRKKIQN